MVAERKEEGGRRGEGKNPSTYKTVSVNKNYVENKKKKKDSKSILHVLLCGGASHTKVNISHTQKVW